MNRAYKVVDVFTAEPLRGNPVAVVLDAQGMDTAAMQAIAAWTNLSETTFILPAQTPTADYRLRIFTPRSELPFAGHPTLGSAHAALEAGRVAPRDGRLVQECGVGLVDLFVAEQENERRLALSLPRPSLRELDASDVAEVEAILGVGIDRDAPPMVIDVGAVWLVARVAHVEKLVGMSPDFARSSALEHRLGLTGLSIFAPVEGGPHDIEVRSFAPSQGVNEDPVCGSGNGSVAVFRHAHGLLPAGGGRYVAGQGQCVGRAGRVSVSIDADGNVELGGSCVTTVDGTLRA